MSTPYDEEKKRLRLLKKAEKEREEKAKIHRQVNLFAEDSHGNFDTERQPIEEMKFKKNEINGAKTRALDYLTRKNK